MLEIINFDMWEAHKTGKVVCITTNGEVRNGMNIMGGGTALQARMLFPNLPHELGEKIEAYGNHLYWFPHYRVVTFPTKDSVREDSKLGLIVRSAHRLMKLINTVDMPTPIYLPRPGAGLGGLDWDDVKRAIESILDDRVIIVSHEGAQVASTSR